MCYCVKWICKNAWICFQIYTKLWQYITQLSSKMHLLILCSKAQHLGAYFVFTWWGFQAGPDDSLKDVALKILQNGVATIPILHSLSVDASNPHLLHLASLSGILKCEKNESDVSIMCMFEALHMRIIKATHSYLWTGSVAF